MYINNIKAQLRGIYNYIYCYKRCTLNLHLKILRLSADLILVGRVFHTWGP